MTSKSGERGALKKTERREKTVNGIHFMRKINFKKEKKKCEHSDGRLDQS